MLTIFKRNGKLIQNAQIKPYHIIVLKKMCSSYIHVELTARRNSQFLMHQTEQTGSAVQQRRAFDDWSGSSRSSYAQWRP